jgi:hypothetical protein
MVTPLPTRRIERLGLENGTAHVVTVVLEPWANEYPIQPEEQWIVEADGPAAYGGFHVIHGPDTMTVHAWDGCDARILRRDGSVVADWTGIRVPDFISKSR